MSAQLWQLMDMDYPMAQLEGVVRLIGECGWSSLPAEQQHGSLAQLKKWHPDYGLKTLVSRSLVLQVSRLLPSESEDEARAATIINNMKKLQAANPDKATGRHAFLKCLMSIVKGRADAGSRDTRAP